MLAPPLHMNLLGALLIVVFGFLFVTVSSRLTGEIGSSSNPISGMTVATLLLTCLIFLMRRLDRARLLRHRALGRRHRLHRRLERRHDVAGSEDRLPGRRDAAYQQIAILIGALASALVLGPILLKLNDAATVYVPRIEQGAGGRRRRRRAARRRELPADAARRPVDAERPGEADQGTSYHVWHKTDDRGRARRQVPGRRRRHAGLPGRSRHQRHPSTTRPDGSDGRRSSTRRRRR